MCLNCPYLLFISYYQDLVPPPDQIPLINHSVTNNLHNKTHRQLSIWSNQ